ncbi:hypothetical protein P167DRAFT_227298 [Morchella conica CCBAS932]|uniref:Uncharacterized protein n=1 Tax=Morchella conica CCBAS932 TaxID=1392247 RepID=A0A3N4KP04_9PEZI|nr:hypothetical protein P167DRAFT_227298 [Morchella conica CCBAS932]
MALSWIPCFFCRSMYFFLRTLLQLPPSFLPSFLPSFFFFFFLPPFTYGGPN